MISIGNDIVSTRQPESSRAIEKRFYSKILNAEELDRLEIGGKMPDQIFEDWVWLHWAIKEAAYKCAKRINPGLAFSPFKITVKQLDFLKDQAAFSFNGRQYESKGSIEFAYNGRVLIDDNIFESCSMVTGAFIHSLVTSLGDFESVYWGIRMIGESNYEMQSGSLRSFLLERLQLIFGFRDLSVESSTVGYPLVKKDGEIIRMPVSFAHHEAFAAYAFILS